MDDKSTVQRWVICPVCHKGNPAGSSFCEHCWGAVLDPDAEVTEEELQEINRRREAYLRRGKLLKRGAFGLGIFAILLAVFLIIYNYTDLILKPNLALYSNSSPGQWSMFHYDIGRSGSAGDTGIIPQGILKWVYSTDRSVRSSPAVVDGTLYIGSQDHNLYALDAETGAERWVFETGSWVESSPAVVDGVVYFGSNDSRLYALTAGTGEKLWEFKTAYPVQSSPAVAGGVVFFGSDDYSLYAVDAVDGKKLWDFGLHSPVGSSPLVSEGIVFVGSGDGYCYAFNAETGQHRLRFKSHYSVFSSPAARDGTVYFVTNNGFVYAVEGDSRTKWREHELRPYWTQIYAMGIPGVPRPPVQTGLLWTIQLDGRAFSSPVIVDGVMYIASDNKMLAIDLDTLDLAALSQSAHSYQVKWEFVTDGTVRSSPAVADGVVYFGSGDGKLYAVDAGSGQELWNFSTGDIVNSSPTVVDGVVYFGSYDGNVYAIE